jgi:uncharacterized protein YbjQ (UPF0145 family)
MVIGVQCRTSAAVQALIREAEEYDGDAIIGLDFEVDGVRCADIDRTPLQPHGRCHVLE